MPHRAPSAIRRRRLGSGHAGPALSPGLISADTLAIIKSQSFSLQRTEFALARAGRSCSLTMPLRPTLLDQDPTVFHRMLPLLLFVVSVFLVPRVVPADEPAKKPSSVLAFQVKDIDGKAVELAKYKGDVLLIVNTASQCGLTPQYEGLEAVYEKYKDRGFEILAFPANEFGHQEPGTNAEIKSFCSSKFNVQFPLFSKIVVKGEGIHPLYDFLTSPATDPKFSGPITWNFAKFLVNRKGEVIARFEPKEKPESPKVSSAIEKALVDSK
jgi:glutathione peroxidase